MTIRVRAALAVAIAGTLAAGTAATGSPRPAPAEPARPAAASSAAEALSRVLTARPARPLELGSDAVPGVLLVTTTSPAATDGVTAAARRAVPGAAAKRLAQRVARVSVPAGSERAAAAALERRPDVVAVEAARYRRTLATPNDPLYPRQWAHQLAGAEGAWDATTGSPEVTVAVLDNGVDARHPDLLANVQEQRVFAGGSSYTLTEPDSDNRQCAPEVGGDHGTHVAGIVGAQGDDGVGVVGVAWQVRLLDYAVFTPVEGGCAASDADVLEALRAATEAGADVVNMSLGGYQDACSTAFQTVISEARAAGTVVVAASGNGEELPETAGQASVPASCNGVISVGAVRVDGSHAPYSTSNAYVDLAAPGGDSRTGFADGILSTVGNGGHDWLDGTSMAAPYVAGAAALLRAVAPDLSPDQVEGILEQTARDFGAEGRDPAYGWGLLHVGEAVALAASGARPAPVADPDFPVAEGGGGTLRPPPTGEPRVYRIDAGTGSTAVVPQAVATSQVTFADKGAAHAVLARSNDFPDALAGSSLTLGYGPLLFSGSTGPLPAATRAELLRVLSAGSTVYLLGGPAALPTALETELRELGFVPHRLAGRNREETAVAIAVELDTRRSELGLPDPEVALLATGRDWPDAVTAGSLGAYYGIPILVTPTASLHPAPAELLRRMLPEALLVAGGPNAVSEATYAAAANAARTGSDGTFRVAGSDRYGTAVALAQLFESLLSSVGVSPSCVLAVNVLRADAYAHALSASSLAGGYACVMVPVEGRAGERLPAVTRSYVQGFGVDGVLAGDVDVISPEAAQDLLDLLNR